MKYINFISCGMVGDFIHTLYVIKNICEKNKSKANIYLTDNVDIYGGSKFTFGANKSHQDLLNTVISQTFVNKFEVIIENLNEPFINLNLWRDDVRNRSWSEFLSEHYKFKIPKSYKWIDIDNNNVDVDTKDKVIIHRSLQRHNEYFNWKQIIDSIDEEIIFVTCSYQEWKQFAFKQDKIKLKIFPTIDELAIGINSCKYFIGNQSAPFALASSLDVNRLVELYNIYIEDASKYMNENKYSENISWFVNDNLKYFNEKSVIKF